MRHVAWTAFVLLAVGVAAIVASGRRETAVSRKPPRRETVPIVNDPPPAQIVPPPVPKKVETPAPEPESRESASPLIEIDWKRMGRYQLDLAAGKLDFTGDASADFLKYDAVMRKLVARWKDDPSSKEREGRELLRLSIDGYLAAMGISLTEAQLDLLMDSYRRRPLDESLELDYYNEGQEGYEPLDSVKNSVRQSAILTQALQGILSSDQMGTYQSYQPANGLWPMFQKTISAQDSVEAVQKVSDYWMSRQGLSGQHRPRVEALAREYYASYRPDAWEATIDLQKRIQGELRQLTPDWKPDLMSMDPYQVVAFQP